ncbi:hypothetical protein J437_LFUL018710 [Ladona fulva]|uniref:Reverse transcriptase domain-containing protein n=1 Tax=Ladona fulva TaxID=123851 RepID=A0A8K0KY66_LADFU|nr:hypothetical protein J437_LFUL018710 [Ladona fulva]
MLLSEDDPEDIAPAAISVSSGLRKAGPERLVQQQLVNYLTKFNLYDPFQSGFRRHHSTATALTKITDDIKLAMDNKKATFLVLIDLRKAFDLVDIGILLAKLRIFNVSLAIFSLTIPLEHLHSSFFFADLAFHVASATPEHLR